TSHPIRLSVYCQRLVDNLAGRHYRNTRSVEDRFAHIHGDTRHPPVRQLQEESFQARIRVYLERIHPRQAVIVHIFADATDTVAAHLAATPVGVVHLHASVGSVGRADEDESIATNASAAVADLLRHRGWIRHLGDESIDVDVVVADAMHFGEKKFHRTVSLASVASVASIA